jgi:hypothetical protein
VGGSIGAGLDLRVGRSWIAGTRAAYNASGRIQELGVQRTRYSGWEVTFGIGRLFGSTRPTRR